MRKLIYLFFVLAFAGIANAQWQADVRLTNAPGDSFASYNNARCVAAKGDTLHTVWSDNRDGNYEIYYKRSTDGGITWGTDTRLTYNSLLSRYPSAAVSGSHVHVVWHDDRDTNREIYYKHSSDGGTTWGADTRLTNNLAYSDFPSIAISGSYMHVVWFDFRDDKYEVYYKRSTDSGLSWGADTRLTNNIVVSPTIASVASVAVSGSNVHVVWHDNRDGNYEIYCKRSTDGGINWGADIRLTNNTASSEFPTTTVSGSNVHVVWRDNRESNWEIYYKRSTDNGVNWGADTRLTNNTAVSSNPSIAVSGSFVHVVWHDNRDGNYEIYYKNSTDSGIIWGVDSRLTNNSAVSSSPFITVSGSVLHAIWQDTRDGNNEIYYKRNPTGNPIGIKNISAEIPSAYSLEQNYPNPFNPTTKIKFDVVRGGDVKIVVYDVMGREVQTLVNEKLQPGTYEATFDASQLTSGVYFYKLITDGFTETKRMILIK